MPVLHDPSRINGADHLAKAEAEGTGVLGRLRKVGRYARRKRASLRSFEAGAERLTEEGWLLVTQLRFAIDEAGLSGQIIDLKSLAAAGDNPVASALADLGISPEVAIVALAISEGFVDAPAQEAMVRAGRASEALDLDDEGAEVMIGTAAERVGVRLVADTR